jgi:hypothetical protein
LNRPSGPDADVRPRWRWWLNRHLGIVKRGFSVASSEVWAVLKRCRVLELEGR